MEQNKISDWDDTFKPTHMNAVFIESLAVHTRVNTGGSLETPFYKISEISREEGIIQCFGVLLHCF
jgi:hypothetical protein